MSGHASISLDILDQEYIAEFDYTIKVKAYRGRAPDLHQPGEPPEPMEFEAKVTGLRDRGGDALEAPQWLLDLVDDYLHQDNTTYERLYETIEREEQS